MADSERGSVHESEPDLSSDDMGIGLGFETQETIERIQVDPDGTGTPSEPVADSAAATTQKRKIREVSTSSVWEHFKKGKRKEDGSFKAICNYCDRQYWQGNSRSTSSLLHHIKKDCKKIPSASRKKPDALQRLLQVGLKDFLNVKKMAEPIKSELDQYLDEPLDGASVDDDFDILSWWKLKGPKYPVMARLARDVLAVPISTVASESTFSIAGRTLSPVRSSLNDESMEALICGQDWLRASVIETGGELGDVLWTGDDLIQEDGTIDIASQS